MGKPVVPLNYLSSPSASDFVKTSDYAEASTGHVDGTRRRGYPPQLPPSLQLRRDKSGRHHAVAQRAFAHSSTSKPVVFCEGG